MLIGLIADVHSNAESLRSIFSDFDGLHVTTILHAGDIIGYGPYPNETIGMFRQRNIHSILGNHDRALITGNVQKFSPLSAEALRWTARQVSSVERDYIKGLNDIEVIIIDGVRIGMVHGSPRDYDEYIYPGYLTANRNMPGFLSQMNCDVVVLGHTHRQFFVNFQEGIVVNPGSAGQPRDGNPGAAFALLDTETLNVTLHRADYDIRKVIGDIVRAQLPAEFGLRLMHGR